MHSEEDPFSIEGESCAKVICCIVYKFVETGF